MRREKPMLPSISYYITLRDNVIFQLPAVIHIISLKCLFQEDSL